MRQKLILIICSLLFVSSCTYHLRYTISSEGRPPSDKVFVKKTYAVEKKDDSFTEHELLKTLTQSLELNGWSKVPNDEAQYIFTVSFETEKREEIDEFWVMRIFRGSGHFLYRNTAPRRHTYSYHYLEIKASSSDRLHTWLSKIKTGPVLQEIETVANHIIPEAISLFPEEGNWKIEDEVYLHTVK